MRWSETTTSPTDCGAKDPDPVVSSGQVVQIIALVKPFRAQAVLAALESVEVLGGTIREAMGYGRQKDRLHQYLGSEYNSSFLPKVELTVFVEAEHVQPRSRRSSARRGPAGSAMVRS